MKHIDVFCHVPAPCRHRREIADWIQSMKAPFRNAVTLPSMPFGLPVEPEV